MFSALTVVKVIFITRMDLQYNEAPMVQSFDLCLVLDWISVSTQGYTAWGVKPSIRERSRSMPSPPPRKILNDRLPKMRFHAFWGYVNELFSGHEIRRRKWRCWNVSVWCQLTYQQSKLVLGILQSYFLECQIAIHQVCMGMRHLAVPPFRLSVMSDTTFCPKNQMSLIAPKTSISQAIMTGSLAKKN